MAGTLTLDDLTQQLESLRASRAKLAADLQAQNGAIQLCEYLISKLEKETAAQPEKETSESTPALPEGT
jgi:hypothetical protein